MCLTTACRHIIHIADIQGDFNFRVVYTWLHTLHGNCIQIQKGILYDRSVILIATCSCHNDKCDLNWQLCTVERDTIIVL